MKFLLSFSLIGVSITFFSLPGFGRGMPGLCSQDAQGQSITGRFEDVWQGPDSICNRRGRPFDADEDSKKQLEELRKREGEIEKSAGSMSADMKAGSKQGESSTSGTNDMVKKSVEAKRLNAKFCQDQINRMKNSQTGQGACAFICTGKGSKKNCTPIENSMYGRALQAAQANGQSMQQAADEEEKKWLPQAVKSHEDLSGKPAAGDDAAAKAESQVAEGKEQTPGLPEQKPQPQEAVPPVPEQKPELASGQETDSPQASGDDPLKAGKDGKIDPKELYDRALKKVEEAGLGKPKEDLSNVGVKKGTKEEWAEFFTKLTKQESSFRVAKEQYDKKGNVIGLERFKSTLKGEMSFGPGQFNKGEYGLKTWSDVNNPDRVLDAYIQVAQRGKVREYFGSVRRPREITKHTDWFDRTVRPRVQYSGQAVSAQRVEASQAPASSSVRKPSLAIQSASLEQSSLFNKGEGLMDSINMQMESDQKAAEIKRMIASHQFCKANSEINELSPVYEHSSDSLVVELKQQLKNEMSYSGQASGDFAVELYCQSY